MPQPCLKDGHRKQLTPRSWGRQRRLTAHQHSDCSDRGRRVAADSTTSPNHTQNVMRVCLLIVILEYRKRSSDARNRRNANDEVVWQPPTFYGG